MACTAMVWLGFLVIIYLLMEYVRLAAVFIYSSSFR